MKKLLYLIFFISFCTYQLQAQVYETSEDIDTTFLNWYNKELTMDGIFGIGTEKAYTEILANKTPSKTVIVAVVDSGVDIDHEDFEGMIWVNEDEIPGNGKDDDGNGYIDDIHGWSFLGNSNGENISHEHLEYVRILINEDESHPDYQRAKKAYDKEYEDQIELKNNLGKFVEVFERAREILFYKSGIEVRTLEDLEKITPESDAEKASHAFLKERFEMGLTVSSLEAIQQQNSDYLDFMLNKEKDYRSIVGDDPNDITDTNYGNGDVIGPKPNHGTAVAGVIAAIRNNELGIDGIAQNVKIMAVRSTPDGDERDKDVAMAIRYAVDNGADIINMSFGKDFSPQKEWVDEAVKYAHEKGVLLVHAAGNDGKNLESAYNFPNDQLLDGEEVTNWIEVGASDRFADENLAASFSNYGKSRVDIFAPGVDILSLDTANTYSLHNGTSLAAPVVAGAAALILSYYPSLTAQQIRELLISTASRSKEAKKVILPGEENKKGKFKKMSVSGGVLNLNEALLKAEKMHQKNTE